MPEVEGTFGLLKTEGNWFSVECCVGAALDPEFWPSAAVQAKSESAARIFERVNIGELAKRTERRIRASSPETWGTLR